MVELCLGCKPQPPVGTRPGSYKICTGKIQGTKKVYIMQAGIHPEYNYVLFRDLASGETFLTKSTMTSQKTEKWEDGNEYPLVEVEISSASHPFYTGKQRIMDSAGRVERFNARFANFGKKA